MVYECNYSQLATVIWCRGSADIICRSGIEVTKSVITEYDKLTIESDKVIRQIGVRDFKNVDYFCPRLQVTWHGACAV